MKGTPGRIKLAGLILAAVLVMYFGTGAKGQAPSGIYRITVRTGNLPANGGAEDGSTLYLCRSVSQDGETIILDSAKVSRKKAVFAGSSFAIDGKTDQSNVFTAGQYDIKDRSGVLFSFFYSSMEGKDFVQKFSCKQSSTKSYSYWSSSGSGKKPFGKENEVYLRFQTAQLNPEDSQQNVRQLLFEVSKVAPNSLTHLYLSLLANGFRTDDENLLPMIADERLVYTSFWKENLDIFLDKLKLAKENVRNYAIDFLMQNKYLTSPRMRAATALECFRRYSSSVVMGCEGSAVHAAEKYILGNPDIPENDRAEAAYYVTVNKNTLLGAKAPKLSLKDTSAVYRSIAETTGSYTVIYFYSDDCDYCKKETPKLMEFLDTCGSNHYYLPLNVYTVYTGTDSAAWKNYVRENFSCSNASVNWIHTADIERSSRFPVDYGVVSTPKMFLLNQGQRIIGRGILTSTLSRILEDEDLSTQKSYDYLEQIFPVPFYSENEELPDDEAETASRIALVEQICQGAATSRENFNRLLRHTFTYLYFNDYSPNNQAAIHLAKKYILPVPQMWDDTSFVEAARSFVRGHDMNRPGSRAENLRLYTPGGDPADLLLKDGRYQILFFYRTNCGICGEAMQEVRQAWEKYRGKVGFTGILASGNTGQWIKYISDNNLQFRQLCDKDGTAGLGSYYYIDSVPQIIIVDPEGNVVKKGLEADMLTEEISHLLD